MISTALPCSGTSDSRKSCSVRISSCLLAVASRPAPQRILRDDAEAEEHLAKQLFHRQERVEDERGECRLIELFEQRPAQRGFAGADVAGQDDEAFFTADRLPDLLEREVVRFAAIQEPRIGRQAERGLNESVIVLVHAACRASQAEDAVEARLPDTA